MLRQVVVVFGGGADHGALLAGLAQVHVRVGGRQGVVGSADDGTDLGSHDSGVVVL